MNPSRLLNANNPALRALFCFCLGILGLLTCGSCIANCLKNTSIHLIGDSKLPCQTVQITPTSMMDDETLFLAAEAQRDSSMNATHRVLNNRWLAESSENTYSGSEALRTVLRMGVLSFWKRDRAEDPKSSALRNEEVPSLAILNWNNYDLEISQDEIQLGFSYRF